MVGTGETWTRNSVSMEMDLQNDGWRTELKNMGLPNSDRIGIVVDPKNSDVVWFELYGAIAMKEVFIRLQTVELPE
jgi:hypothetical protein